MNFLQAIGSGFRNYANFQGRAVRSEYWYWALFVGVASNIAPFVDQLLFPDRSVVPPELLGTQFGPAYLLTALALILPGIAVAARRLHDLDRSAWWLLLWLTVIGGFVLLYWFCKRGTAGPNRFGPVSGFVDPKILSVESPAGQPQASTMVAEANVPQAGQPTQSMPLWLKAPLIVVAVVALLMGGAALAIYLWVQSHGAEVTAAGEEGVRFAANKNRAACVDEAVARVRRGSGLTEAVKDRQFLEHCLKTARPTAGFCDNVPGGSEIAASATWQKQINQKYQLKGTFDQSLLSEIQSICDADRRGRDVASAPTRLPQCPSDTNVPWTGCQGTRAIAGAGEYVGEFRDDAMNGHGTLTNPRGEQYAGGFKDGRFDGHGTYSWPDGRKFAGEYRNGKAEGSGEFTSPGGLRYFGNYKNDRRHGQGELTLTNGERYVGEFKDGNFDGQGAYTWPDGRKYEGFFKNGKRNGQGVLTSADGGKYIGGFREGSFDGQGEMISFNGQKYVGEFKAGKFEGRGTYAWPNGQKYAGEYRNGKFEGLGTLIWPSGQKYVGEFRDGKRHGMGKLFAADGSEKQSGIWENDTFVE